MKKQTLSRLKAKAWKQFSLWIRLSNADAQGYVACITCGAKKHWKEIHASHFIPGRNNAVLFSEEGVHPGCYHCNIGLRGNWPEYYKWMLKMYGQETIDRLLIESKQTIKYTREDYLAIEKEYKQKIKEIESKA